MSTTEASYGWSSSTAEENVTNIPAGLPQLIFPSLDSFESYRNAEWLWRHIAPVMIFGGGLSNMLMVLLLSRLNFGWRAKFLLTLIAVADCLVLGSLLPVWIRELVPEWNPTIPMWKLTWFSTYFADDWSAWTLVLLQTQRTLTLAMKENKLKTICSSRAAVGVWLVVTLLLVAVNAPPFFLTWECFPTGPVSEDCQPADQQYREEILPKLDSAIDTFAPGIILGVISIGLIKLRGSAASRGLPLGTMWGLTLLFFITKLPYGIFMRLVEDNVIFQDYRTSLETFADFWMTWTTLYLLAKCNSVLKLSILAWSGRNFRRRRSVRLKAPSTDTDAGTAGHARNNGSSPGVDTGPAAVAR